MTTLTEKFTALEEQLASQNATIAGYIDTVEAKLQTLADELDTITINNAANTKALLSAIGQSGACFPCPTPSVSVPPTGTTPFPLDDDRCKRAQAFVAAMHSIFTSFDTMQSFNVIGTYNVVSGAISEAIGAIVAGDTVPLPSLPETINIVGDYISYAGERVFSGVSLMDQFGPLESSLIDAVYLSNDATSAQSAYNGIIEGSGVSNAARLLFEATGYNALYTYFFDTTSTPDLSAYDGTACGAPSECVTLLSDYTTVLTKTEDDGNNFWSIGIPYWAASLAWDITLSSAINVLWATDPMIDGSPATGVIQGAGFSGTDSDTWTNTPGAATYFGVGGFFAGLPNGSTVTITVNSLVACPAL